MTPQWFTDLALKVVREMDYGVDYQVGVDKLWAEISNRFEARGSHDRSELFPWTPEWDESHDIEAHRRRYWRVTPYHDHEREAILKRWSPPES
jgi:hypothetical protein